MATIKETFTEFYAHGDRIKLDATLNGRRDLEEIQVGIDETYPNPTSGEVEAAFVEIGVTPAQIYDVNELLFTARIAFGLDEDNLYAQALTNGVDGVQLAKKESGNITIDETTRTADEWRDDGVGFATDTAILYLSADSSEVVAVDEQWEGDIKYFLHQTWMTIFELHNICATLQEQEAIDLWDTDGGEKVEGYVVRYVEGNADGFNDDFYCTPTGGYEGVEALEGAGYSLTEPVVSYMYIYTNPSADEITPITIGQYDYRRVYKEDGSEFKFDRISSYGEKASTFNLEERDYTGAWKPTDSVNPWFPLYLYGTGGFGYVGMKDSGIQRPVYALRFKQPEISDEYYYLYLNQDGAFFETYTAGMQKYHDVYDAEGNAPSLRETYGNLDEQEGAAYFDGTTWRTDFWMRYIRLEFSSSLHRLYLEQTIKLSAIRWKKPAKPRPVDDSLTLICYLNSNKTAVAFSSNGCWFAILDYEQLEAAQDFGVGLNTVSSGAKLIKFEQTKFDYEVVEGLFSDDLAQTLVYSDLSNLQVGTGRGTGLPESTLEIQNSDSITVKSKTWKIKITKKPYQPEPEPRTLYFATETVKILNDNFPAVSRILFKDKNGQEPFKPDTSKYYKVLSVDGVPESMLNLVALAQMNSTEYSIPSGEIYLSPYSYSGQYGAYDAKSLTLIESTSPVLFTNQDGDLFNYKDCPSGTPVPLYDKDGQPVVAQEAIDKEVYFYALHDFFNLGRWEDSSTLSTTRRVHLISKNGFLMLRNDGSAKLISAVLG